MRTDDQQASASPSEKAQPAKVEATGTGVGTGLVLGILVVVFNFPFEGCGASRVSNYFARYQGSAGYSHLAVKGRVQTLEDLPRSLWRNLHYGSKLRGQKKVTLDILQAEVPTEDIEAVFLNEKLQAQVKVGQTYCFHVSHVGNYYSFLLQSRYGFEAYSLHESADNEHPSLVPDAHWARRYKWYSLCALILPILFLIAASRIIEGIEKSQRRGKRFGARLEALPFIALYIGAAAYIAKFDWVDHIWPVGKTLFLAILIGLFTWSCLKNPEPT